MAAETSTRNAFLLTLVNACFENNCSDESVAQMTGIVSAYDLFSISPISF